MVDGYADRVLRPAIRNLKDKVVEQGRMIRQQAQRIAELEAELKSTKARMWELGHETARFESARDALRAALVWLCDHPSASSFDGTEHKLFLGRFEIPHEVQDGASIAAALIRAHRESEGK